MIWTILYVLAGLACFVAVYRSREFTEMRAEEESPLMLGVLVLWVLVAVLIVWPIGLVGLALGRLIKRSRS